MLKNIRTKFKRFSSPSIALDKVEFGDYKRPWDDYDYTENVQYKNRIIVYK